LPQGRRRIFNRKGDKGEEVSYRNPAYLAEKTLYLGSLGMRENEAIVLSVISLPILSSKAGYIERIVTTYAFTALAAKEIVP
jgi:hypothetical protein